MITYQELNEQNHKITELSNILTHLLGDRSLCDSEVTCDLFFQYVELVNSHLDITDKNLHRQLLTHKDQRATNVANLFLSGSREIKRIFGAYLKKWCRPRKHELIIKEYDTFLKDTEDMFEMVLDRIQDETERLYPLIREVRGDSQHAA
jgi:hypothetical protein